MTLAGCKNELLSFLRQNKSKPLKAVVMPDFFLDRLINLGWDVAEFSALVADVAKRKGGSIDGIAQMDIKGGNAVNTASALAALGVSVTPIVCTSAYGLHQIKYHFKDSPVDFSHVKIYPKASITTALELKTERGKVNVMLRDVGALADFGPEDLMEEDYVLVEDADYVCLFNWAGTKNHGTALAQTVFGRTERKGRGKTYYDTADPLPNKAGIADLLEKVLKTSQVDILSLNENEAVTYASLLDESVDARKEQLGFAELALEAARVLAKRFSSRIDLHTTAFSATLSGNREVVVPTFKVEALRATGAGDAWNAGNVLGDGNGLSDECRLMLANAVSACYLSDVDGLHPSWRRLERFITDSLQG
jgi:sugar/nucleoside kinase (ribokinase family)